MYSPPPIEDPSTPFQSSPERKINQVKQLASNAYELINILEAMKKTRTEKKKSDEKFAAQHAEIFKSLVKDMARTNGSFA